LEQTNPRVYTSRNPRVTVYVRRSLQNRNE